MVILYGRQATRCLKTHTAIASTHGSATTLFFKSRIFDAIFGFEFSMELTGVVPPNVSL